MLIQLKTISFVKLVLNSISGSPGTAWPGQLTQGKKQQQMGKAEKGGYSSGQQWGLSWAPLSRCPERSLTPQQTTKPDSGGLGL